MTGCATRSPSGGKRAITAEDIAPRSVSTASRRAYQYAVMKPINPAAIEQATK